MLTLRFIHACPDATLTPHHDFVCLLETHKRWRPRSWQKKKKWWQQKVAKDNMTPWRLSMAPFHPVQIVYSHCNSKQPPFHLKSLLLFSIITFSPKLPPPQRDRCVLSQQLMENLCVMVQHLESRDTDPISFFHCSQSALMGFAKTSYSGWKSSVMHGSKSH